MKLYFTKNISPFSAGRSLKELKNLEWIFIGVHSFGVPAAIIMAVMHDPVSVTAVTTLAVLLAVWNALAALLNHRITTVNGQLRLGIVTQLVVVIFAWAFIFQFLANKDTASYGGFAVVIVAGAVRFGLIGSLVVGVTFALGLASAMIYRDWEYGFEFTPAGYVYWTLLMFFIALSVGMATEEARRERRRRERLVRERTLLEERHRIARDMHDTVLKTLHGLALEAHTLKKHLDSPAALKKVDYLQGVCQRSSQEIRDVIHELRTDSEDEGIASQMSRMLETWSKATGIETDFSISGQDRSLSLLASHNLRNVLSEALVNIRKHANASKVGVSIELLPREIRLEIEDNGKGISLSGDELYEGASKGKYGILGMKERIEQLNGQFSIDSSVGTRLTITVPLN